MIQAFSLLFKRISSNKHEPRNRFSTLFGKVLLVNAADHGKISLEDMQPEFMPFDVSFLSKEKIALEANILISFLTLFFR